MKDGKGKKRQKLITWTILILIIVGSVAQVWFFSGRERKQDIDVVLEINGEKVRESEAMIYYRLMELSFEEIGTDDVWDLDILGFDPQQEAIDRVIESIIRIKVVQPLASPLNSEDYNEIRIRTDQLENILGQVYINRHHITRELMEKVVMENYQAHLYEANAHFRSSDFEEDIQSLMAQRYGIYDELDQEQYLRTIKLIPMMFYTGQFSNNTWVSYPEVQKEQIFEQVLSVYEQLETGNFYQKGKILADSVWINDNPVFEQGAVMNVLNRQSCVYAGQILEDVAEILLNTEKGTLTPVIQTEYGYLICYVIGIEEAEPQDYDSYQNQLLIARNGYRNDLIQQLKNQRMEEEWKRLEQDSVILRYVSRFSEYVFTTEGY